MDIKKEIIKEATLLFNAKGMSFSMDEIASDLKISKKTIYKYFNSKNDLIIELVDEYFNNLKISENKIYNSTTLSTYEKIEKIFCINKDFLPLNLSYIDSLSDTYPILHKKISQDLKESWYKTFTLLNKGMEEGCIKKINIEILKALVNGFFEHMFKEGLLSTISYHEAISEVSNIIMNGIRIQEDEDEKN